MNLTDFRLDDYDSRNKKLMVRTKEIAREHPFCPKGLNLGDKYDKWAFAAYIQSEKTLLTTVIDQLYIHNASTNLIQDLEGLLELSVLSREGVLSLVREQEIEEEIYP